MFGNVIAEKSNNIFTRTNKLFQSNTVKTDLDRRSRSAFLIEFWMSYLSKISTTTDVNWKQEIWFFTKSSAISPKVLNLFAFIDCNKGMSSLIRVVLEISKNGQCLYYRNVLFQLMYKICLTGFAHCAIIVKQLCWNRTNWKRQNLFNSNVLLTICKNQFPTKN